MQTSAPLESGNARSAEQKEDMMGEDVLEDRCPAAPSDAGRWQGQGTRHSRRAVLGFAAAATSLGPLGIGARHAIAAADHAELASTPAVPALLAALERYPLVALGEHHQLQEFHDLLGAVLCHPDLPAGLTDIVVEFGNARYQAIADRFIMHGEPVANANLQQIWRLTIGGDILWDAPVYAQFFRTVRAVNWMRPVARRIRVLLGDPPFDLARVHPATDAARTRALASGRDAYVAALVEREVLAKGRRALLVAGYPHLRRGLYGNERWDTGPLHPNAATLLAQRHPGALFVAEALPLNPGWAPDTAVQRLQAATTAWPRPALARLTGTWLGAQPMPYRAIVADAVYSAQVDAVLYLNPDPLLTASRADPAIYHWGAYPAALRRLSEVLTRTQGQPVNLLTDGLHLAQLGPSYLAGRG
jgi:hypothetical protein